MARAAELETSLAARGAELEAAVARIDQITEQATIELTHAHRTSTQLGDELAEMMKRREEDAQAAAELNAANARKITQMNAELDAHSAEAAALRDRCRRLQAESAQLALEAQEQRDQARSWNEDSMRARSELQSEMDRSASANRGLMDQLEAIKADFYAFLSLFHPAEAAAAIVASTGAASSGSASSRPPALDKDVSSGTTPYKFAGSTLSTPASASTARSPGGSASASAASGTALVNKLANDMTDLRKRLEVFTSGSAAQRTSSAAAAAPASSLSGSGSYSRSGTSSGAAYMSRELQADVRSFQSSAPPVGSSTLVGLGSTSGSLSGRRDSETGRYR